MNDFRWIGREGEKIFSLLCSRSRVTCNKAEEDDRGWDFIIQFPAPSILHVPIDQRTTGPAALVQVKTTKVEAERWSISLSNALSLAKSPLPAFIVRVGIGSSGREVFRAVHVWREQIIEALRAARQAHVEGDEAVHRRTITVRLDEDTERDDPLEWMLREIQAIGENDYASAKRLLNDTLGYENGAGVVRFEIQRASPEALTDLRLGLIDGLEVQRFSFTPSRFGIEARRPDIELDVGRLEIMPTGRDALLRLRAPDGRQEMLPATVLSAPTSDGRTKIRIKTSFLDVAGTLGGPMSVTCTPSRSQATELQSIRALALLRRSQRGAPLSVAIKTEGLPVGLGVVNMRRRPAPGWQQLLFITEALALLTKFEGSDPFVTSLDALTSRFLPLSVLDALVCDRTLMVEFAADGQGGGGVGSLLAYVATELDGHALGAVASRPTVLDETTAGRRRIYFGPATIRHAQVLGGTAATIRDRYWKELDELSTHDDVLAIGDLNSLTGRGRTRELTIDRPRVKPGARRRASKSLAPPRTR